jgi:hypothetical protein
VLLSILLAAACGRAEKPAATASTGEPAPVVASPPVAPASPASAPPAAVSSAQCLEYQALLVRLGKEGGASLAGRTDHEVFLGMRYDKLPIVGGARPVVGADEDATDAAIALGEPSTYPREASPLRGAPKLVYLAAERSVPVAEVKKVLAGPAKGKELRLLVLRSEDELMAELVQSFPRTPSSLRARLGRPLGLEKHVADLAQLSRPCRLGDAFLSIQRGGGMDVLFPAVAQALEACHCDLADLDGFVSLLAFAGMPWADGGYLVVDARTVAGLPADATVTELALALAKRAEK